jgi:ATP-dependent helicase/nuclease subunit B
VVCSRDAIRQRITTAIDRRAAPRVRALVGFGLGGASFTPRSGATPRARLGEPVWGGAALLRDLELRLALSGAIAPRSVRVPRHAARIIEAADANAFYAASFASDAVGTADALLGWRDILIESGWNGRAIAEGGDRLAALARLEAAGERVPAGDADRLVAVHDALSLERGTIYDEISLVEDRSIWPGRWLSIFAALETSGTRFTEFRPDLPGAPRDTDLGRVQGLLRNDPTSSSGDLPDCIRGDGSLLVLRGDTPAELASMTAALLATSRAGALVIRSGDAAPLEAALGHHGLSAQGLASSSAWRPAMQILPLTVELAFEPRDPYRALELLTLGVGPFRGVLGRRLAKAVARSPGIGGREWQRRKAELREFLHARERQRRVEAGSSDADAIAAANTHVEARMDRVAAWFEATGANPQGATASVFREIAERVHGWLLTRVADAPEVYGPALVQAKAFAQALLHDHRAFLSREEVRQLVDTVVRAPHDHARSLERAGRIAHVPHPSAALASCNTVVLWNFIASTERRASILPWNRVERAALAGAGVHLQDTARFFVEESAAWRRAVLSATARVVLVIPGTNGGAASVPHSLWDEISARLRLDGASEARVTRHARDVREGRTPLVPVTILERLSLPDTPAIWKLTADVVGEKKANAAASEPAGRGASATSLETLVGCPLRWVLEERAELAAGGIAKVASDALLCGNLGHRLVEELFDAGAFDNDTAGYAASTEVILARLIEREAATLLLPGMAFERVQLVAQLLRAARNLRRYLDGSGYRIVAVEEEVLAESPIGTLRGRVDVRLADPESGPAVLDLKWGEARYRDVVKAGHAIQLAAYAGALRPSGSGPLPPAGYFALRSGRVVTADPRMKAERTLEGETLDVTWERVKNTARAVVESLSRGEIPVAGLRRSLPLLDSLGVEATSRGAYLAAKPDAACTYCSSAPLCGRAWEGFR